MTRRKKFTDNTSSRFKVQLSEPLNLTKGPWDVGLLSLSMPDARLKLQELSDPDPANLIETESPGSFLLDQRLGSRLSHRRRGGVDEGRGPVGGVKTEPAGQKRWHEF